MSTLRVDDELSDHARDVHFDEPVADWRQMGKSEHFVQFYEGDDFLTESVAAFISAGLLDGEAGIIIATPAHREQIDSRMAAQGVDVAAARAAGLYVSLDAKKTLAGFMVNDLPDRELFLETVGVMVGKAAAKGGNLRAFGEMVALLWTDGNSAAAIQLEEYWNDLVKQRGFSLFCAYPIHGFRGAGAAEPFIHICKEHSRVLPAESYRRKSGAGELPVSTSLLQQKANSLETEIARRKEIEKALARREEELADFLENATEAIHQVGPDGTILWANKAELDMLGYSAEEFIGQPIQGFHADQEVISDLFGRLLRGETVKNFETRLRCKNGSIRDVSINSSVYWKDGAFIHTKCFTRDITDQKRAAAVLEEMVFQRTAQLRETIGELEAFSYSVSHDMRSPLRAMQAYADTLLLEHADKLDGDALTALQRIQRSAARLDLLVREVLAYSLIAKSQIDIKPIALEPLVADLLDEHPAFQTVQSCVTVEKPLPAVIGHEGYLTQCITNLLDNALKFVAPGTTSSVRIHSETTDGCVRLRITDNGIGIAPEHHDRIFKLFSRVYPEKFYAGTGIGLAIVKKAVTRMGGEAGFDSEPGKGSSFWFTLPKAP